MVVRTVARRTTTIPLARISGPRVMNREALYNAKPSAGVHADHIALKTWVHCRQLRIKRHKALNLTPLKSPHVMVTPTV